MRALLVTCSLLLSFGINAGCSCSDPGRPRRDSGPGGDRDAGGTPGGETGTQCTDGIDNDMDGIVDCDEATCVTFPACGRDGGPIDAGFATCEGIDVMAETAVAPVDIVWIIDNSGSMGEETSLIQMNLNNFVASLTSSGIEDYRVVVITDPDEFGLTVAPPLGTDTMRFRMVRDNVQSNDALSHMISTYSMWSDFIRTDSVLHFIHVTDDESSMPAGEFMTQMSTTLGGRTWTSHVIASPPGSSTMICLPPIPGFPPICTSEDGCSGAHGDAADNGDEYWAVASMTGGLQISICSDDWSVVFDRLEETIGVPMPIPCEFAIPEPPEGMMFDPLLVNVDYTPSGGSPQRIPAVRSAAECPAGGDGWYYDDPASPTQILLCPSTCDIVEADTTGTVNIALGCATIFG